jgi:hypothetical protein
MIVRAPRLRQDIEILVEDLVIGSSLELRLNGTRTPASSGHGPFRIDRLRPSLYRASGPGGRYRR